jgi:hypothetical protein
LTITGQSRPANAATTWPPDAATLGLGAPTAWLSSQAAV